MLLVHILGNAGLDFTFQEKVRHHHQDDEFLLAECTHKGLTDKGIEPLSLRYIRPVTHVRTLTGQCHAALMLVGHKRCRTTKPVCDVMLHHRANGPNSS